MCVTNQIVKPNGAHKKKTTSKSIKKIYIILLNNNKHITTIYIYKSMTNNMY